MNKYKNKIYKNDKIKIIYDLIKYIKMAKCKI